MELYAVVVPLLRQEDEVVDGLRRMLRIERKIDRAAIGLDRNRVVLRGVDRHFRRCRPLLLRHASLLSIWRPRYRTCTRRAKAGATALLELECFANRGDGVLVELAHQLADEQRLTPLRPEAREPARLDDSLFEELRQCERGELLGAKRDQPLAKLGELLGRALAGAAAASLLLFELFGFRRVCRFFVTRFARHGATSYHASGAGATRAPQASARACINRRSRSLRVSDAARSNSARASPTLPSLTSRSPRTAESRW